MIFSKWTLRNVTAKNRIVRSATYEGMADYEGNPSEKLKKLYVKLAENDVGTIITGFCYVSKEGRAMQIKQCGIDNDKKISLWENIVSDVKNAEKKTLIIMQIAHAGRQTLKMITGLPVIAPSGKKSPYFKEKPIVMNEEKIKQVIREFQSAAFRAKKAGFDGIQIHAAHGYLIHQFLSPYLNNRKDKWGKDRFLFLREIITAIMEKCGENFPVFVKISAEDDHPSGMNTDLAVKYIKEMKKCGIEAVEISYGTMDTALNIFRGGIPVERVFEHNILFNKYPKVIRKLWKSFIFPTWKKTFIPFSENYNLSYLKEIRKHTNIPLILVGGIRKRDAMDTIVEEGYADAIALCRPFICEPDLVTKLEKNKSICSQCTNCNICAVMCDSNKHLHCYKKEKIR